MCGESPIGGFSQFGKADGRFLTFNINWALGKLRLLGPVIYNVPDRPLPIFGYFRLGSVAPVGRTEKPPFAVSRRSNGR